MAGTVGRQSSQLIEMIIPHMVALDQVQNRKPSIIV